MRAAAPSWLPPACATAACRWPISTGSRASASTTRRPRSRRRRAAESRWWPWAAATTPARGGGGGRGGAGGGATPAGRGVLLLPRYVPRLPLVVREPRLDENMSRYL